MSSCRAANANLFWVDGKTPKDALVELHHELVKVRKAAEKRVRDMRRALDMLDNDVNATKRG